jgi:hypothetical protein
MGAFPAPRVLRRRKPGFPGFREGKLRLPRSILRGRGPGPGERAAPLGLTRPSYPLRGPNRAAVWPCGVLLRKTPGIAASVPFFSFRFLLCKILRTHAAGLHAGQFGLSEFCFAKLQGSRPPCHFLAFGFCFAKTYGPMQPASMPAGLAFRSFASHNVSAVCDGLTVRIEKCVAFLGLANCAGARIPLARQYQSGNVPQLHWGAQRNDLGGQNPEPPTGP